MSSIWQQSANRSISPPLQKNTKAEIAVIGGGLAGILTAYLLSAEGKQVIVLERKNIGSGQTGLTTAKVTSQHGSIYTKLEHTLGISAAGQYAQANEHAISAYRQLIRMRRIRCGWEDTDACLYSTENADQLYLQAQAQQKAGLKAEFCEENELPFPTKGTVRLRGQGQFHPLQFLYALAEDLTIFENTRVQSVDGGRIETEHATVDAEQVIFCCHFPFINLPGAYFMKMHQERSYILALAASIESSAHFYSVDTGGLSLRQAGGTLLLGGGAHRTGESGSNDIYESLRRRAALLFPRNREVAHWSAQDCITDDSVPYIGRFASSVPNWYVATGFGKWGMSTSMVAARLLNDLILGRDISWGNIFSPQRITFPSGAATFFKDGIKAVQGLGREIFPLAHSAAQTLAPGQGGVVELNGEKIGLYRTPERDVWAVDVRCPHLGCELAWNNSEKSWDCPCHGSRYDYRGQSLNGPAQTDLPVFHLSNL